jgi:formylglycine-generating enzyme required for sulfatase activity
MRTVTPLALVALAPLVAPATLHAQSSFGSGCAGASGVTPTLAVRDIVQSGSTWTLEVTAPGGLGLGYLAIGFSNTTASAIGGLPLPLDLGVLFGDPLWSGCALNVDPSYSLQPYAFDPSANGGVSTFTFPGFDFGVVHMQAVNLDPDFATRIAGVSQGLTVRRTAPAGMVAIQPGTFQMGSTAAGGLYFATTYEAPVHTVTISYPFWMGAREVTQAEYTALTGSNPSSAVGPNLPVESLQWSEARDYCAALTVAETLAGNVPAGYEYRLPTEAEWEYACRAGTTTEFNTGAELLCSDAHVLRSWHQLSVNIGFCSSPSLTTTKDVGSYPPNAWGLYDMHGNVHEWCLDVLERYEDAAVVDPFVTSDSIFRVYRGGSFGSQSPQARSAWRFDAFSGNQRIGFRVVLAPVLVP